MRSVTTPLAAGAEVRPRPRDAAGSSIGRALAERLLTGRLERLASGELELEWRGRVRRFGAPARDGLTARVRVRDGGFFARSLLRGSIGAAEAFADGAWETDDLVAVVRLFVRNLAALRGLDGAWTALARPVWKLYHALRDNDRAGSRANVAAHYDVSNEFFALFLDPTMSYSAGIYERPDAALEEASLAKIDRLCRALDLRPGERLLEIGTGWGALACRAAERYGARVTTATISREQHDHAQRLVAERGLAGRVEVLLCDYRDLAGVHDKLVSVEMVEAVGHRHLAEYFAACARLLRPDGLMALQAITIADQHYDAARRSVDFIQRYVFPGSQIPSVTALASAATRGSDLRIVGLEEIGLHYARTLADWRAGLAARRADALRLGFDERSLRLWDFYFAYCEGGFAERHIGNAQVLLAKPRWDPAPVGAA